jgi:5,6-dimethylbenzimidazole synthase
VQNLWLAARAEGIGVGWVSIVDPARLAETLQLPAQVYPLAYLCLGYVSEFLPQPELQIAGWRSRLPLEQLLHGNTWDGLVEDEALIHAIRDEHPTK